ncbi:MAG: ATP-binding cassette domain-containing protein [Nitrosomonas sp.]|nr:ATP-binding cassette domain-containing protein [Nitrosomonas sp.]MCW5608108.1 ATP-binding cassette domain-containing protein [Nitrosomonas sp.]
MTNHNASSLTLSAKHLSRAYNRSFAVHDVTLQLEKGEILGLLGPNGAGKSTTMRMLTGNLAPSSGSIEICGIDLLDNPKSAKAHLGYLPEIPPLYMDMTVDEFLGFVAQLHRIDKKRIVHAIEDSKKQCGLTDRGKQLIGTLSKGLQQRIGIAQAIIHEPDIIILDEPTVGLDPNQIREMRQLIRALGRSSSIILSTHILSEVESSCDRVLIMNEGRIVLDQALVELRQKSMDLETIFTELTQIEAKLH